MAKKSNDLNFPGFFDEIKNVYAENRELYKHFDNLNFTVEVTRGRSHTVSSKCEDLLALYIGSKAKRSLCVHIDQALTIDKAITGGKRNKIIYPDISLVEMKESEPTITNFIDLKMDIAWNRKGFDRFVEEKKEFLCLMKGRMLAIKKKKKLKCKCSELKVSTFCNYHVVVVSEENAGGELTWEQRKKSASKYKKQGIYLYTLSSGLHPNGYTGSGETKLHPQQFNSLMKRLLSGGR